MALLLDNVGLCKNCGYCRVVKNARSNAFYLCRLAENDARFPKYPRLPVLQCSGYIPRADAAELAPDLQTGEKSQPA